MMIRTLGTFQFLGRVEKVEGFIGFRKVEAFYWFDGVFCVMSRLVIPSF